VAEIARFMRRNRDLERVLDFYEDDPSLVFVCLKEELNLGTPGGRLMARVFVSMAEEASAASSSRVTSWHADKAERGESSGGAYRAFGWGVEVTTPDGETTWDRSRHNEPEAEVIRDAVDALLEARTNYGQIAAEWTSQGLLTPRGNAWSGKAVRAVMQSGRLAGYRIFHGEIAVNPDTGERVMATDYQGIIDVPTWEALQLALKKAAGPQSGRWHGGGRGAGTKATAKYLLSGGLAICGECWKALSGTTVKATGRHSYLCTGVGGCGTVGIAGDSLDALAAELFQEWASGESADAALPDWPRAAELADLRAELAFVQAEFKARRIKAREAVQIIGPLSMEVDALEAEERTYAAQAALVERASGDLLAVWNGSNVHGRRALLPRATAGIVVRKRTPGFRAKRGEVDLRRLEILPPLRPAAVEAPAG
jgi:site-specific DNA recombinase